MSADQTILVSCPHCGADQSFYRRDIGRQANCQCGNPFTIQEAAIAFNPGNPSVTSHRRKGGSGGKIVSSAFGFMFDTAVTILVVAMLFGSLVFGASIFSNAESVMHEILAAVVLFGGLCVTGILVLALQLNTLIRAVNEQG